MTSVVAMPLCPQHCATHTTILNQSAQMDAGVTSAKQGSESQTPAFSQCPSLSQRSDAASNGDDFLAYLFATDTCVTNQPYLVHRKLLRRRHVMKEQTQRRRIAQELRQQQQLQSEQQEHEREDAQLVAARRRQPKRAATGMWEGGMSTTASDDADRARYVGTQQQHTRVLPSQQPSQFPFSATESNPPTPCTSVAEHSHNEGVCNTGVESFQLRPDKRRRMMN